jgi:ABC-type transporter Mla maintaining outer membrane lipid asymmetry ATPase subunit MlaF
VLLGPFGTGKSAFLKSLIGLLRPERGKSIFVGTNIIECSAKELDEIRTLARFGCNADTPASVRGGGVGSRRGATS